MILGKDINPKKQIYYLSAMILKELNDSNIEIFDYLEVYHFLKKKENISINLYSLSLDWLFLLGVIKKNNDKLKKCI